MSNLNDVIDQFLEILGESSRRGQAPRSGFDLDKIFTREDLFSMNKHESDMLKYISWSFNQIRRTSDKLGVFEYNMSIELKYEDLQDVFSNKSVFHAAIKYFVKHALLIQKKPRSTTYFFNPFVINNFTDKQNQLLGLKPTIRFGESPDWADPYLINDKLETF